jgi:hypothetical protein
MPLHRKVCVIAAPPGRGRKSAETVLLALPPMLFRYERGSLRLGGRRRARRRSESDLVGLGGNSPDRRRVDEFTQVHLELLPSDPTYRTAPTITVQGPNVTSRARPTRRAGSRQTSLQSLPIGDEV